MEKQQLKSSVKQFQETLQNINQMLQTYNKIDYQDIDEEIKRFFTQVTQILAKISNFHPNSLKRVKFKYFYEFEKIFYQLEQIRQLLDHNFIISRQNNVANIIQQQNQSDNFFKLELKIENMQKQIRKNRQNQEQIIEEFQKNKTFFIQNDQKSISTHHEFYNQNLFDQRSIYSQARIGNKYNNDKEHQFDIGFKLNMNKINKKNSQKIKYKTERLYSQDLNHLLESTQTSQISEDIKLSKLVTPSDQSFKITLHRLQIPVEHKQNAYNYENLQQQTVNFKKKKNKQCEVHTEQLIDRISKLSNFKHSYYHQENIIKQNLNKKINNYYYQDYQDHYAADKYELDQFYLGWESQLFN